METLARAKTVQFGPFTLDLRTGELTRAGLRVRLQGQAFRVLAELVSRPGELVTREELEKKLWPGDTFVDFESGLNTAVKRLREALGDSAEKPKYIETLPRSGYRFVGEVTVVEAAVAGPAAVEEMQVLRLAGLAQDDSSLVATDGEGSQAVVDEKQIPPLRSGMTRRKVAGWVGVVGAVSIVAAALGVLAWRRAHAAPAIHSLAVLPFANLSGDASQDYFADAMTEELTGDLGNFAALRVISRTSAMLYKKTQKTVPEIARELNVDGVIEGSVVRSGDRVRITAQLIHAPSDRHLWAESYERDLKDVLALESEIARTIAGKVEAVVTPAEEERMRPQEVKPEAYEAYLRGRAQLEKWTTSGATEALRYFEHAIALDNRFALAYVGVAETYTSHPGVPGVSSRDARSRAMGALMKAIELKPEMGEAHVILGGVRMEEWDFTGAEAEMREGLSLSPGYGAGHHWYSHLLLYQGRNDEAIVEAKKMLELDPLSPAANNHMGYTYEAMRDWDQAIDQMHKTLLLDPNYVDAHESLGRSYMGKGMYPEGVAELRRAVELVHSDTDPDYAWHSGELGYALARSGNTAEAKKILAGLPKDNPVAASVICAGLRDKDKSIALLREAYRLHDFPLDAGFLVLYDSLRSDPRFSELLHDVGLR